MHHAVRSRAPSHDPGSARWRARTRVAVADHLAAFVRDRCAEELGASEDTAVLGEVLTDVASGGKLLRSAFLMAGWACGAAESPAALRAAASVELLHCFALLQDDVMDESATRRGRESAHVRFARWHRAAGLTGSARRFGESAAVLAGDLCLVWADRLLRESGLAAEALARARPRYDALRAELAIGQFRDLVNDARREPSLADVLAVARAKSGDYTVRRPLELGAELAGCPAATVAALGRYGSAVGEAFQLRDDLLGLFGVPEATGKPVGEDLRAGKATSVVVIARERADPAQRRILRGLAGQPVLTDVDIARYLGVISETEAPEHVRLLIDRRLAQAGAEVAVLPAAVQGLLSWLARSCVDRDR
ncbi:(2E,6E)-farnesyl diphosphate synthase [Actinokineospora sp. UTMC 2448]|nr:(2E,6E)-farnesyl diphosphate synthase [Actinokineospora sp. UTMC 2448]